MLVGEHFGLLSHHYWLHIWTGRWGPGKMVVSWCHNMKENDMLFRPLKKIDWHSRICDRMIVKIIRFMIDEHAFFCYTCMPWSVVMVVMVSFLGNETAFQQSSLFISCVARFWRQIFVISRSLETYELICLKHRQGIFLLLLGSGFDESDGASSRQSRV